jgi:hypothetical protein
MTNLNQSDHYYGAALVYLFREHIKPALINIGESRQEYEFTTNNRNDFVLFLMYRVERSNLKDNYYSWNLGDIRSDLNDLAKKTGNGKRPILGVVCLRKKRQKDEVDLKKTELAFLFPEDIEKIKEKSSITITRMKREKEFRVLLGGKRDNSLKVDYTPDFSKI